MRGLYPIIDFDALNSRGIPVVEFAEAVLSVHPAMIELRAKSLGARRTVELLRRLRPLASQAGSALFANDRPDLALVAGCDGVHVGQDDLAIREVRQFAPHLRVGISTHNLEQLKNALAERPDYVAYGPVFRTTSKQKPEPEVGIAGLKWAMNEAEGAGCPLVAIGGIDINRAREVAEIGAMGAVIEALLAVDCSAERVVERALTLHRALGGHT